jgi:hypothetical protein
MQKMTRRALGAAGLAFIVTTSAVYAQDAQPVRVRGEITKVDGNTISVKARDGQDLTVKLADNSRVAAMVKASLADIKEGSFIGVSAMPQSVALKRRTQFTYSWIRSAASWPIGIRHGTAGPAAP